MVHGVRVARSWLEAGDLVTIALPRNLHCAGCDGGGCDRCGRAGAVSLWGRDEPPALLELTLPQRTPAEIEQDPVIVLRIPDAGGFAAPGSGHPRGLLLLRVTASAETGPGVTRTTQGQTQLPNQPSLVPPSTRKLLWAGFAAVLALVLISYLLSRP